MTNAKLSKLKSLAEAAKKIKEVNEAEWLGKDYDVGVMSATHGEITRRDLKILTDQLAFAANPQVILSLIGQLEAAILAMKSIPYITDDPALKKVRQFLSTLEQKEGG